MLNCENEIEGETLTKLSPESKEKKVSKLASVTTIIRINDKIDKEAADDIRNMSFLLCLFDNIVGPKTVHYWKVESESTPTNNLDINDQLIRYISIHTLNGELYQDKLMGQLKYRLYLIKEIDHAIFSIFFDASTIDNSSFNGFYGDRLSQLSSNENDFTNSTSSKSNGLHKSNGSISSINKFNTNVPTTYNCLSVILPLDKKDVFLKYYGDETQFFINTFENIIIEYKAYAHVKPKVNHVTKAIDNLTEMLNQFCLSMITLKTKGLFPSSKLEESNQSKIQNKIHIQDTYLNDIYFTTPTFSSINNDFLINCITSHMITNFHTIVVGKTSASINKMIKTLGLFMPNEKLRLSCHALEDNSMLSPYFYLQGFVTENPEDLNSIIDCDFLFKRNSPTTIIDISYKQVYRTAILNDFYNLKETFIKKKVQFLFNSLSLSDLKSVYSVINYLSRISSTSNTQKSTLILNLLKQMDVLESDFGVKDSFLDMVQKDLFLLALNLIEYINNEITLLFKRVNNINNKKDKQLKISKRKITKDLDIKSEDDLYILIAYANYLKPGFSLDIIFQA